MHQKDLAVLRKLHNAGRLDEITSGRFILDAAIWLLRRSRGCLNQGTGHDAESITWYAGYADKIGWTAQGFSLTDVLGKIGIEP